MRDRGIPIGQEDLSPAAYRAWQKSVRADERKLQQQLKSAERWADLGATIEEIGRATGLSRENAIGVFTKSQRSLMTRALRAEIISRDGGVCACCGVTKRLTVDHIVPIYRGGRTVRKNLQVLCGPCNSGKRHKLAGAA